MVSQAEVTQEFRRVLHETRSLDKAADHMAQATIDGKYSISQVLNAAQALSHEAAQYDTPDPMG